MGKPGIIVLSKDTDDCFDWQSDGWNELRVSHTPKARALMAKATKCIRDADNVKEAIVLLRKAGFVIRRGHYPRHMRDLILLDK